jgi:hypothetical protein
MAETSAETPEQRYRRVPDREPLEVLPGGLVLVRSMKREPISSKNLTRAKLLARTNKRRGSKFLPDWTLTRYVEWSRATIAKLGWTSQTGMASHEIAFDSPIGISHGEYVSTIRLVSDGRYVHAYPVRLNE